MTKPYYEQDGITIYHGDCREILPELPKVDLVLTDPPYGIGQQWKGGFSARHGWSKSHTEKEIRNNWDSCIPPKECFDEIFRISTIQIIWGGNYFDLPPSRCWFIWVKPERNFTLAEAEMAWTNLDNVIRVKELPRHETGREHPTQKPVKLMTWCIDRVKGNTILDPFMGSGTTLVAAKQLGRQAIGIEIEEKYCEIAVKRLGQGVLQL